MNYVVRRNQETGAEEVCEHEAALSEVESFVTVDNKVRRRYSRSGWFLAAAMTSVALAEAAALVTLVPLVRLVPVLINTGPNGVTDLASQPSELPIDTQDAIVRAELWMYVQKREGYSSITEKDDYAIVSEMSDNNVRKQYQDWINHDKESPVKKLGTHGDIHIERVSGQYTKGSTNAFSVEFKKTIHDYNEGDVCQVWVASMTFTRVSKVPLAQRLTFNPAAIVITSYPSLEQKGLSKC